MPRMSLNDRTKTSLKIDAPGNRIPRMVIPSNYYVLNVDSALISLRSRYLTSRKPVPRFASAAPLQTVWIDVKRMIGQTQVRVSPAYSALLASNVSLSARLNAPLHHDNVAACQPRHLLRWLVHEGVNIPCMPRDFLRDSLRTSAPATAVRRARMSIASSELYGARTELAYAGWLIPSPRNLDSILPDESTNCAAAYGMSGIR